MDKIEEVIYVDDVENKQNEVISTKEIQMFSVTQFMSKLDYTLMRTKEKGYVFVSRVKNPFLTISMNTAIQLHNCDWKIGDVFCVAEPSRLKVPVQVDMYTLVQAASARIVDKVKLQYSKKKKEIIVLSDKVKFVNPQYFYLFMNVGGNSENIQGS